MKYLKIFMVIIIFALVGFIHVADGITQGMGAIRTAANEVNGKGILIHEPANYFTFFDDFFFIDTSQTESELAIWKLIITSAGAGETTVSIDDSAGRGGILKIQTAANDNDGVIMQHTAEFINIDTTGIGSNSYKLNTWRYEWDIKLGEVVLADLFCGLTPITPDSALGDSINAVTDGIFFYVKDDNDTIFCVTVIDEDSIEITQTNYVLVDSISARLSILWNGRNKIEFYKNNSLIATHIKYQYMPVDEMLTPSLSYHNGSAVSREFWANWVWHDNQRATIW